MSVIAGDGPIAVKTHGEENFPVASLLLPAALRPHVMAFYRFVRLADDIADNPDLEREEKLGYLDRLEAALVGTETAEDWCLPAVRLAESLAASGVDASFARRLLTAFRRDAINEPCRNWDDLIEYCRYSAVPVGRYLMALHGETEAPVTASDALCTALQILNHLQDCGEDWRQIRRLYIPLDWLTAEGLTPDDLLAPRADEQLRRVLDLVLDRVDALLIEAAPLARRMRHRRLALESAVIVSLAERLRDALRRRDPLAERVELAGPARLAAGLAGILAGILRR